MVQDRLNVLNPSNVVTQAMAEELRRAGGLPSDLLSKAESERDYPKVSEVGRVIDAPTRFVVIEQQLKESLERQVPVPFSTLLAGSVQLWATKIERLGLQSLHLYGRSSPEIYLWGYDYDPDFLGYMAGVLKLEEFIASGGAVI
jgi:hypothetical protein